MNSVLFRFGLISILSMSPMVTGTALAATDTWNKTAAGTTYSWIDLGNWLSGSSFPNGIGDVANLNIDIVGAQTISLD
jgi:hypothetical protein